MYTDRPLLFCGSEPAREGGLTADQFLSDVLGQIVGAGLPAMDVNDDAGCLNVRGVPVFFASRLAPTGKRVQLRSGRLSGRLALALAFDLLAPSRGRAALRFSK